MSIFATTWRQLVRRRLWPIALLLVAALAAVPLLLARDPEPVEAPAVSSPSGDDAKAALADPIVALASEGDRDRRRRVLGSRKDPFAPAKAAVKRERERDQLGPGGSTDGDEREKPSDAPAADPAPPVSSGGGGSSPSPVTPVAPQPAPAPVQPKKSFPAGSLTVRFGDPTGDLSRSLLEKLEALPADGEEEPLLVYLGLTEDHKQARFLVDARAEVTGDGRCKPHPSSCETILLRRNETEFFDVTDDAGKVVAQYQLDLVEIHDK